MFKKSKITKLALTFMSVGILGTSASTIASCAKKRTLYTHLVPTKFGSYSRFFGHCYDASISDIIGNQKIPGWKNMNKKNIKMGRLTVQSSVSVTREIINISANQIVTFTICYNNTYNYDAVNWKYDNDINNRFVVDPNSDMDYVFQIFKLDNKIYAATITGLYVSINHKPFIFINNLNGISNMVLILNIFKVGNITYLTTAMNLYYSTDGINFKKDTTLPEQTYINDMVKIDNLTYIITQNNGLWVANNGITFSQNTYVPQHDCWIYQIIKIDNKIYLATNKGLYVNSMIGDQEFIRNNSLPNNIDVTQIIKINNTIYLGTWNGIYTSNDGQTFSLNLKTPTVNKIVQINNIIYVATNKGFYKSYDNKRFELDMTIDSTCEVYQMIDLDGIIYIATDSGIFNSSANNHNFLRNPSLWHTTTINQIIEIDHTIYLATDYSLWSWSANSK